MGRLRLVYFDVSEDRALRDVLLRHLAPLEHAGLIELSPGGRVFKDGTMEQEPLIAQASILLLLISAAFLQSFPWGPLIRRVRQGGHGAQIVPVLLRPAVWELGELGELQPLPRSRKPVASWSNRDEAWVEIVREILHLTGGTTPRPVDARVTPWNVPRPSPYFSGRNSEIAALRTALVSDHRAAVGQVRAVSGLGGLGKTQLALEYARRYREEYRAGLFLRADSILSLQSSLSDAAQLLSLRHAPDPSAQLLAMLRWMESNDGWLLILDNADALDVVAPLCSREARGHVLLTTRASNCTSLGISSPVRLPRLQQEESFSFFLQRIGRESIDQDERDALEQLSAELDHLPLALEQAGAYIADRDMLVRRYLRAFQERRTAVLRERPALGDYAETVATTWLVNIQQVHQESLAAVALMELSAFLAPSAIPEELLLRGAPALGTELAAALSGEGGEMAVDNLMSPLLRFSLIERERGERSYSVHRLVQEVIKGGLEESAQRQWAERIARAMALALPPVEFQSWKGWERLIDHALAAADLIERWSLGSLDMALLLNEIGLYLSERAQYATAEPLFRRALSISEAILGPEPLIWAGITNNLARICHYRAAYQEAELLHQRALRIRELLLGSEHPAVAESLDNLAMVYESQHRYPEAEPLCRKALAIFKTTLGPDHIHTATCQNNLALVCMGLGKISEVEALLVSSLTLAEKKFGPDHPEFATGLNNLALHYQDAGQPEDALVHHERALAIRERALGPRHPDVAQSLYNLSSLHHARGSALAESLLVRAIAIKEEALGPHHPSLAPCLLRLATIYAQRERWDESERLFRRTLELLESMGSQGSAMMSCIYHQTMILHARGGHTQAEVLYGKALALAERQAGHVDSDFITCLRMLARLSRSWGKSGDAERLYQWALTFREQWTAAADEDCAELLWELASFYDKEGRDEEAERHYVRAIGILELLLGPEHQHVGIWLNNLAGIEERLGRAAEAERTYLRSLRIFEQTLGEAHPEVGNCLGNLAGLYSNQQRSVEAEQNYLRAVEVFTTALGPEHPQVASWLFQLASFYAAQKRYKEAERSYLGALSIDEAQVEVDASRIGLSLNNLAMVYFEQGRLTEAASLCQRALAILEQVLGTDAHDVGTCLYNLASIYRAQGKQPEAKEQYRRALAVLEGTMGSDDPQLAAIRKRLREASDNPG